MLFKYALLTAPGLKSSLDGTHTGSGSFPPSLIKLQRDWGLSQSSILLSSSGNVIEKCFALLSSDGREGFSISSVLWS